MKNSLNLLSAFPFVKTPYQATFWTSLKAQNQLSSRKNWIIKHRSRKKAA